MPSPLSLSNFTNRLSRSLSTLQILPRRTTSNKSLKNRKATKIQSVFRGRATRRKLETKKLETQAEHLFCKVELLEHRLQKNSIKWLAMLMKIILILLPIIYGAT